MNLLKKLPPPENPKVVLTIDAAHAMFGHYDEPTTMQCAYARGYGISRGILNRLDIAIWQRVGKERYQK